jgi:hypothetical protein
LRQVRDGIAALIAANDVTAVGALPVRASVANLLSYEESLVELKLRKTVRNAPMK